MITIKLEGHETITIVSEAGTIIIQQLLTPTGTNGLSFRVALNIDHHGCEATYLPNSELLQIRQKIDK